MMDSMTDGAVSTTRGLEFVDEAAFRAWYETALQRVFGYLLRRTGDAPWAEDLAQRAFIEAIRARSKFRREADPTTWVIAIARRKLIDDLRARDRRERGLFGIRVRALAAQSANDLSGRELAVDLQAAVAGLPAMQRAAVVLCYVDGLPVRDAASLLHRSEKATESLLSRARVALRLALREDNR